MTARLQRSAAWAGLIAPMILIAQGCGNLNPAFVSQLGGNASTAGPQPTGSILFVVNNQTPSLVELTYDHEFTRAGEFPTTGIGATIQIPGGTYFVFSFDCATTSIDITDLTVGGTDVAIAVNEFRAPTLQCGSIVFVTVQGVGATAVATAEVF